MKQILNREENLRVVKAMAAAMTSTWAFFKSFVCNIVISFLLLRACPIELALCYIIRILFPNPQPFYDTAVMKEF